MKVISRLSFLLMSLMVGCQSTGPKVDLALGDSESVVVEKMRHARARNVTDQTRFELYQSIGGAQKYCWWELPDRAIVGVLLGGKNNESLKVVTVEIGEPNKGVAGIEHWRSQKLKRYSSLGPKSL
jgi:hypothetical protein